MDMKEHDTILLLEEVSELIDAAIKLQTELFKNLRFGDVASHPLTGKNTVENITVEANDVLANLKRLKKYPQFQAIGDIESIEAKTQKVDSMVQRSVSLGAIKGQVPLTHYISNELLKAEIFLTLEEYRAGVAQGKFGITDGIGKWAQPPNGYAGLTDVTECPEWATHVAWRSFSWINNDKEKNHG